MSCPNGTYSEESTYLLSPLVSEPEHGMLPRAVEDVTAVKDRIRVEEDDLARSHAHAPCELRDDRIEQVEDF